jgi:predicted ABC-type ATPase
MNYNIELPNSLNERIFEKIKKKYLLDIRSSMNPQGIILGGQPGSGKSFLQKEIAKEFTEDFIFISTDDLRLYHPAYLELQQNPETVQNAANLVNPYASAWTEKLIKYCIKNKYNLIIDSTLGGNIQAVYDTIDKFRYNRYQVHLRVMAVPAIISKLSIFLRYETQLAEKGFARWTRMEDHDDRFNNLKINLLEIESIKTPDSIKFYGRVLEESGTNQLRCLEGFEVKDLGSIELIYEELLSIGVISYKVSDLIYKRKGNSNDFKDFLQVLSLQILKFFEG